MITTLDDFKTTQKQADEQKYTPEYTKTGNKEYKHADVKDIAKELRKQYKAMFPDIKISVTINRFAGGESIDAKVKEIPKKYLLSWDEIKQYIQTSNNYDVEAMPYFKKKYDDDICHIAFIQDEIYEQLQDIHSMYKYAENECYTDYYYTNYFGNCNVDGAKII